MSTGALRRLAGSTALGALVALVPASAAIADVSGTVTTSSGAPVPDAYVTARDATGRFVGGVRADGAGSYTLKPSPSLHTAPFTVTASVTYDCTRQEREATSPPVADGAVQNLVVDPQPFCADAYPAPGQPEATALVVPERGEVLSPSGGRAYVHVSAPTRATGLTLSLADGTVVGRSEEAWSLPLDAPAGQYAGPLNLTYTYNGVASTRAIGTLLAGKAPAPARPSGAFDLAAIVDVSGSMSSADPTNRRKDAVHLLVDLATRGDRLAAIGFDDDLREIFARTPVTDMDSKARLKRLARGRIGNFGGTDYDVGFSAAFEALTADPLNAAVPKAAIFLTDGAHNGAYGNSHLRFAYNGTGAAWPVCVVQLGKSFSADDTARLKRIARETGGTFVKTPTNTQLESLYFQCRGRTTGAKTVLRRTQVFTVGQTRRYAQRVRKGQRKATFFVSYDAGRYRLRLTQPGGRTYTRTTGKRVRLVRSKTFSFFEVTKPKAGRWRLAVKRLRSGGERDRATTTISLQGKVRTRR